MCMTHLVRIKLLPLSLFLVAAFIMWFSASSVAFAAPSFTAETSTACGGVVAVSGSLNDGGWTTYLQVTDETNKTVYFGSGVGMITGTIIGLVPESSHTYRARVFNSWGTSSLFGPVTVTASAACPDPEVNVNFQR